MDNLPTDQPDSSHQPIYRDLPQPLSMRRRLLSDRVPNHDILAAVPEMHHPFIVHDYYGRYPIPDLKPIDELREIVFSLSEAEIRQRFVEARHALDWAQANLGALFLNNPPSNRYLYDPQRDSVWTEPFYPDSMVDLNAERARWEMEIAAQGAAVAVLGNALNLVLVELN